MIRKLSLSRWTYVVLCVLACVTPIVLAFVQVGLGLLTPVAAHDDLLFALAGSFMAIVLTYPAGVVGTFVSWVTMYFGFLTPTESVLLAAPVYLGAGYLQWYVLIPKYFRLRPNSTLNADTPRSSGGGPR